MGGERKENYFYLFDLKRRKNNRRRKNEGNRRNELNEAELHRVLFIPAAKSRQKLRAARCQHVNDTPGKPGADVLNVSEQLADRLAIIALEGR